MINDKDDLRELLSEFVVTTYPNGVGSIEHNIPYSQLDKLAEKLAIRMRYQYLLGINDMDDVDGISVTDSDLRDLKEELKELEEQL